MKAGAIHLSFGNAGIVHVGYIAIFLQPFGLIVAGLTPVVGSFAFPSIGRKID